MGRSEVDARPDRMLSGEIYHRTVKRWWCFWGSRTHTVIPWSGNDSGDGIPSTPDALEFRYPYTQELLQPDWIRRRGSVLYGTDPMRIWGPHKNSWIRIRESESGCIRIAFSGIRGSGPSPDPELYAFRDLKDFWRVRIRGSGTGFASHSNSFRKFLLW